MIRQPLPRGLYAIADGSVGDPVQWGLRLLRVGCPVVQLRVKGATTQALAAGAARLVAAAPPGALVIVNDDIEAAAQAGAHGVHLGQDDGPLATARARLGPAALIGRSTHTPGQITAAAAEGADYIGFGPVFATTSKADTEAVVGIDGLTRAVSQAPMPVIAIGGITANRLPAVRSTGVHGWAMISAVRDALSAGGTALHALR